MRNKNGFTLIEMIVVIVILGIVSLISFAFIGRSASTYQLGTAEGRLNAETCVAMAKMVREVRGLAATSLTVPAIPVAPATTTGSVLTFTDATKAACANCQDKAITPVSYTWDSATGNLYRSGTVVNQIVASGITAFTVTRTPIPLTTATNLNYITITLTKTYPFPVVADSNGVTLTESVFPNGLGNTVN